MNKEQTPRTGVEKLADFNKKVGVGLFAVGIVFLSEALILFGGLNYLEGHGIEKVRNYFKRRKAQKHGQTR